MEQISDALEAVRGLPWVKSNPGSASSSWGASALEEVIQSGSFQAVATSEAKAKRAESFAKRRGPRPARDSASSRAHASVGFGCPDLLGHYIVKAILQLPWSTRVPKPTEVRPTSNGPPGYRPAKKSECGHLHQDICS